MAHVVGDREHDASPPFITDILINRHLCENVNSYPAAAQTTNVYVLVGMHPKMKRLSGHSISRFYMNIIFEYFPMQNVS